MEPLPIEFHPDAVDEAAAARRWYSEIDIALGRAFADELDRAMARIASSPERWGRHLHGTRVFLLHRFPYLVVYRPLSDHVQVLAV